MQVNLLNFLLGVQGSGGASVFGDGTGGNGLFSQLLGGDDMFATSDPKTGGGLLGNDLSPAALVAQEMGFGNPQTLLGSDITPEDANALIGKLDALIANGQGNFQHGQPWQELKQALQQVADGSQPVKLADVLEEVPTIKTPGDAADNDPQDTPLMRVLAWVQQALEKKKEAAAQTDAEGTSLNVLGNGLQAGLFPAVDAAAQAQADASEEKAALAALDEKQKADAQQPTAIPEWLTAMMQGKQSAALDEAIPPLELKGDDALPVVTLPQIGDAKSDDGDDVQADAHATPESAKNNAASPTQDWLKHLPFPLRMSDAAANEGPTDVSEFAAVSAHATAKELREASWMRDSDTSQQIADNGGTGNTLNIAVAPSSTYTRSGQIMQPQLPLQPFMHASPADQVRVAIHNAKDGGIDRITIQLDPAELGRVEVRMNMNHDGDTHMIFTADKASTLDLLSREAHGLERSLADSGIKADAGSMEFNLRQQPQFVQTDAGQNGSQRQQSPSNDDEKNEAPILAPLPVAPAAAQHLTLNVSGGVDIEA